jgi:hypothetical protein
MMHDMRTEAGRLAQETMRQDIPDEERIEVHPVKVIIDAQGASDLGVTLVEAGKLALEGPGS